MKLPGFEAHSSLYTTTAYYGGDRHAYPVNQPRVLPQVRRNETFIITPTKTCYCYEDTEAQASVCECD